MNTKIEEIDGKFVATLEGEMDTAAAVEAEEVLKPLYQSSGKDVIIDCKGLEYIASSGLRILLSILKAAKAAGSKVITITRSHTSTNLFITKLYINQKQFEKKTYEGYPLRVEYSITQRRGRKMIEAIDMEYAE